MGLNGLQPQSAAAFHLLPSLESLGNPFTGLHDGA